jgi:hypothetical protein
MIDLFVMVNDRYLGLAPTLVVSLLRCGREFFLTLVAEVVG